MNHLNATTAATRLTLAHVTPAIKIARFWDGVRTPISLAFEGRVPIALFVNVVVSCSTFMLLAIAHPGLSRVRSMKKVQDDKILR